MARVIAISSGKGGVGKTTVVSNLATSLAKMGHSVVAIDSNLTTSNLGLHLGIHLYPTTLHDVLEGKADLRDAIYLHNSGFKIIPADISLRKMKDVKSLEYMEIFDKLMKDSDFILVDCAAGLGKEAVTAIRAADEMIIVTNPELPAVTEALKLSFVANKNETRNLGIVINRVKNESHELPARYIEDMLNVPVLGKIPEDKEVRKSIAMKQPIVTYSPKSPAAQHLKSIAAALTGEKYEPKISVSYRLFSWLR